MGTFVDLQRSFEALDTEAIAEKAVEETKEDLLALNKKQLLAGYDKNGELIGDKKPYANAHYAFFKANMNPLPGLGNPDLRLTGSFQDEFDIEISGERILQGSSDEKAGELEQKYGEEIYGLGGKFKVEYVDENLRPAFQREITKATGLNF